MSDGLKGPFDQRSQFIHDGLIAVLARWGFAGSLAEQAGITAADGFGDAGEVVLAVHALDSHSSIVGPIGAAVTKGDL